MWSSHSCASPKYSWLPVTYTRAYRAVIVPSGAACDSRCATVPSAMSPAWHTMSGASAFTAAAVRCDQRVRLIGP
jgi:hypothetical protein